MSADCRAAAARCLADVYAGASLSEQIGPHEQALAARDRALFRQLCYGVLRDFHRLAAIAAQLLDKPLKNKDSDVWMLILLGGYQLDATRIPDHAAIGATVASCASLQKGWARGLVNAVLRNWQRRGSALAQPLTADQRAAHPLWLFQQLQRDWPAQAEAILAANNAQAPLILRVNRLRSRRDTYLETLAAAGIAASPCVFSHDGIRLHEARAVDELPGFADGQLSVQDEAAQLAAPLLELKAGQRVLDACAAPGGKSCHILESEPALSELLALDSDARRLTRVADNLQRLQLKASLRCGDASRPQDWWDGVLFDRILLDAPCSATGVIRRHPDIKLHRRAEDIETLAGQQQQLLHALWPLLKPGGRLLYATCSVLPRENEQVVTAFLTAQSDARHVTIDADWGEARPAGRQLFPQLDDHDGFFYAVLEKAVPP